MNQQGIMAACRKKGHPRHWLEVLLPHGQMSDSCLVCLFVCLFFYLTSSIAMYFGLDSVLISPFPSGSKQRESNAKYPFILTYQDRELRASLCWKHSSKAITSSRVQDCVSSGSHHTSTQACKLKRVQPVNKDRNYLRVSVLLLPCSLLA